MRSPCDAKHACKHRCAVKRASQERQLSHSQKWLLLGCHSLLHPHVIQGKNTSCSCGTGVWVWGCTSATEWGCCMLHQLAVAVYVRKSWHWSAALIFITVIRLAQYTLTVQKHPSSGIDMQFALCIPAPQAVIGSLKPLGQRHEEPSDFTQHTEAFVLTNSPNPRCQKSCGGASKSNDMHVHGTQMHMDSSMSPVTSTFLCFLQVRQF